MKTFTPDSSIASDVIPSANYGERNKGRLPDMIVLHYTGMPDVEGAIAQLCTAGTDVSAHYIVWKTAASCNASRSQARLACRGRGPRTGEEEINSCSIGIEIVNRGHDWGYPEFPLRQIAAVIAVPRHYAPAQGAAASRAGAFRRRPGAQKDPGEKFPWHSLANSGVGHWVQPAPIVRGQTLSSALSATAFAICSRRWPSGYGVPINGKYDAATMEVVTAFQRHFRPARVEGIADHSTLTTLQSLLASLSADAKAVAAK
jgi:N-acetylmuramoyl-L-alanine amidase